MWDDPHISQKMLEAHLDPSIDAASRNPETIDATVDWIIKTLDLQPGMVLLDLGCGPGLYCQRFSAYGLETTGMDYSRNSIDYARQHDPTTTYHYQNYLTLDMENAFDVVTLIYGDFCVFSDADREVLLGNIRRALRPGGAFVFDVTTPTRHQAKIGHERWFVASQGGFWKPGPYLVLEKAFNYPAHDTVLMQNIVIEADMTVTAYRNWFHGYTPETLMPILTDFVIEGEFGDLTGAPYMPDSEWCGIIARKIA